MNLTLGQVAIAVLAICGVIYLIQACAPAA